ncbi:MAG: tRNA (N6-isopentenyl adenosine(37)-C2)-methylthiotransferase MiaB [Proteobacteria bacterium]|nr:tRNA (N6-isopentenyl adenosine(37)-C2)-methylthiotransferase MiaB [Pseudomonadota bacterium]
MAQKVFYIKTFGCQMNERDSEIMAQTLSSFGYIESMNYQEADLVIVNTCSIRAKAEQKVLSLLGYLRKAKKNKPSMKICVAGCVAQQEGARIIERMPHVDLVLGTQQIYNLEKHLQRVDLEGSIVITDLHDKYQIPQFLPEISSLGRTSENNQPSPSSRPCSRFVTIMQGCNNYCTYCVVPYTRGREVSRRIADIVDEVKILVAEGVREITLLGQNVNSYGKTNAVGEPEVPITFTDLLKVVSRIEGVTRLRFTTSNPKDLTDELMCSFRDIANLCPQFHLPVQSGSDRVLAKMNRKYTISEYLQKVDTLHEYCPEIALTTDVIVGFPGEDDEDFEETMTLLEKVRFHGSFSFKYSDRSGTRASAFLDKVDEGVKVARLRRFQGRQDEISLERNREYIGTVKEVMIEECAPNGLRGRTDTNHIVHLNDCSVKSVPGEIIATKILRAGQHSLQGEIYKKD